MNNEHKCECDCEVDACCEEGTCVCCADGCCC